MTSRPGICPGKGPDHSARPPDRGLHQWTRHLHCTLDPHPLPCQLRLTATGRLQDQNHPRRKAAMIAGPEPSPSPSTTAGVGGLGRAHVHAPSDRRTVAIDRVALCGVLVHRSRKRACT
jgi:hypothetical protein